MLNSQMPLLKGLVLEVPFDSRPFSSLFFAPPPENLALVRRLALSLLKQHPDQKSIACKRLQAALDPDFLTEVVALAGSLGNV